jgi:hypothetical protein
MPASTRTTMCVTATLSPTQVRCSDEGLLTARCTQCATDFVQAPDADVRDALAALDRTHPRAAHRRCVPEGWLPAGTTDPG